MCYGIYDKEGTCPSRNDFGPCLSVPLCPGDFSSDGFRCKEQNTPAPAIKAFVVSNKKLPVGGPGCRLGESGL